MGFRWLEQSEEDPLVYQTGHRDDRNSPKCIIGKVQIIICPRQLVTKRKGRKLRRTAFQSQLDLKLEGVGLEDLQPDMSSDNLQWLLSQEKLNCRTCGLHH